MSNQIEAPIERMEIQDSQFPMDQIPGFADFGDLKQNLSSSSNIIRTRRIGGVGSLVGAGLLTLSGATLGQDNENTDTAALVDTENPCPPGYHIEDASPILDGGPLDLPSGDTITYPEDQAAPADSYFEEALSLNEDTEITTLSGEYTEPDVDTQNPDQPLDPEAETENAVSETETIEIVDPETGETIICTPNELEKLAEMPEKYSLKSFLKLEDKKISKDAFFEIMNNTAPTIVEYNKSIGFPKATVEAIVKNAHSEYDYYSAEWTMGFAGKIIADSVAFYVKEAQNATESGNFEAADALFKKAEALVRLGKSKIKFDDGPGQLDTQIKKEAIFYEVN